MALPPSSEHTGPRAARVLEGVQLVVRGEGQHPHRAHLVGDVAEVDAHRHRREVRVRPELDVLVPLLLAAAVAPLEVELAVVELEVRAQQVRGDVGGGAVGELPVDVVHLPAPR